MGYICFVRCHSILQRIKWKRSDKVDELRVLRNKHTFKHLARNIECLTAFNNAYERAKNCFNVLKLPTTDLERIKKSFRRSNSPSTKGTTCFIFILSIIIVIVACGYFLIRVPKSHFRVLPTKPVHLIANRSLTVNAILQELKILGTTNRRSLTHLYISGNPGSGKSQLARLIGERYAVNSLDNESWFSIGSNAFVMTLNGRSLNDLLVSYVDFARRLD